MIAIFSSMASITVRENSMWDIREKLLSPLGGEDVDLEQFVANDIEPDEDHAVIHQFWPRGIF